MKNVIFSIDRGVNTILYFSYGSVSFEYLLRNATYIEVTKYNSEVPKLFIVRPILEIF